MAMSYGKPTDALGGTAVGSAEDPDYVASNLISESSSKPAKLTTTSGTFTVTTSSATVAAAILVDHNIDPGVTTTINGAAITIPALRADGSTKNAAVTGLSLTNTTFTLSIGTNSQPISIGRLVLLTSLRTFDRGIKWGDVTFDELENFVNIGHRTELGVELFYELAPSQRTLSAQIGAGTSQAAEMQDLFRSCRGRARPFTMISDHPNGTDPWLVRFVEETGKRTFVMNGYNMFEWQVQEVARGLPWP